MYFNAVKNGQLAIFEVGINVEDSPSLLFTLDAVEDMTGMVYEYDLYGRILNTYAVNGTPGALFADR